MSTKHLHAGVGGNVAVVGQEGFGNRGQQSQHFAGVFANLFIRVLFGIRLNDTTNAFKAYRRSVLEGCQPILSPHFNITVELPLKAIVRGYSWKVIPITWRNRRSGLAKLKIREMGSRYFFIVAYVWLEKYFSRGDYRRQHTLDA
jgi:dolichol-phosphate mannosyltransferase